MNIRLKFKARLPYAEKPSTFELSNVNLKHKIQELKKEVTKRLNMTQNKYELVYCGCVLEDESTLESCGLKSDVTIHIIIKKENNIMEQTSFSDHSIVRLASIFRSLSENDSFRNAYQRFSNKDDFNDNLIEAIPELRADLVSLAIVNDPILMLHFTDTETIKRAAKSHPTLVEAAQYVAAAIQEEAMKSPATSINPIAGSSSMNFDPNMSFNMDSSNEMEDMDSSQSTEPTTPQSDTIANTSTHSGITIAQLAAALASAQSNPSGSVSATSSNRSANAPRISSEMFSQAMQQAFESTNSSNSTGVPVSPVTPVTPTTPQSQSQNIQVQLNLMHEMGLLDDAVNIQALHFTNGDVQAAIELVFSGFGDN